MNADQLAVNTPATSPRLDGAPILRIRAVMLGERINPSGLEIGATVSSTPAAFRVHAGLAVIFRYGVVVLIGLLPFGREGADRQPEAPRDRRAQPL
ncbi:hypothetical protein ACVWWP_006830 [Bradyrhizobium sp. LM3.6]